MAAITQMENERVNRSNNGYKGKRTENGFRSKNRMVTSQVLMVAETDTENQTNHIRQKMEIIQNRPIRKIHRVDMEIIRADMVKTKMRTITTATKSMNLKKRLSVSKEKSKDIQPDKADIAMRFEKEKKIMQKKKQDNKKNNQSQRHQVKVKRSNNIDWTREYENDSYDDDDMSYYY